MSNQRITNQKLPAAQDSSDEISPSQQQHQQQRHLISRLTPYQASNTVIPPPRHGRHGQQQQQPAAFVSASSSRIIQHGGQALRQPSRTADQTGDYEFSHLAYSSSSATSGLSGETIAAAPHRPQVRPQLQPPQLDQLIVPFHPAAIPQNPHLAYQLSYASPPPSHQQQSQPQPQQPGVFPSSTSASSPDHPLLRHPHDPRLLLQTQLQAQFHAAGYFQPDANANAHVGDFPDASSTSHLVPIQTNPLRPAHLLQQSPIGNSAVLQLPGSAPLFYSDDTTEQYDLPFRLQHHSDLQSPGGGPMPFMHNELSILNAESFDDGVHGFRAPRSLPPRRSILGADEPAPSRKRTKVQASDASEMEEEEKKRSRGRPRLDTNDQTAQDRRRTQIRLAQRAYRNRKETAIQTLEKKVDELKSNNEEMSNAFMNLYDFAVSKGMLDSAPEFGRQLQATTQKFVALARRTSDDARDGGPPASQEQDSDGNTGSPGSGSEKRDSTSPGGFNNASQALYAGIIVSHELDDPSQPSQVTQTVAQGITAIHSTAWAQTPTSTSAAEYEIITQPTLDNASFPFGMSLEPNDISYLDPSALSSSPYSLLPAPTSYSYQERTFGRRLQRAALEQGLALIQMPNPPPHIYAGIFGFCLLFEPKEKIMNRLANRLSMNHKETLSHWKAPFLHLGGAGTFFDGMENEMQDTDLSDKSGGSPTGRQRLLIGNQGTFEPDKMKEPSMFSTGPWSQQVEDTRDIRVDHKMRITMPGFEGDFYDCDEVEFFLQQRGIVIPPAADFVTAEIDINTFSDIQDAAPSDHISSALDRYIASTLTRGFGTDMNTDSTNGLRTASDNPGDNPGDHWLNMVTTPKAIETTEPIYTTESQDQFVQTAAAVDDSNATTRDANHLNAGLFDFGEEASPPAMNTSGKRLVTVNVGVLVQELVARSVCLGRTPGVRPKDVLAAFWSSLAT